MLKFILSIYHLTINVSVLVIFEVLMPGFTTFRLYVFINHLFRITRLFFAVVVVVVLSILWNI